MDEIFKLLILLALSVLGNILGGVYVNINLKNIKFDKTKLLTGVIKSICVSFMFISLSIVVKEIPGITDSLGIQPETIIVSAIIIYQTKIINHLMSIFGIKKENISMNKKEIENKEESEYLDM